MEQKCSATGRNPDQDLELWKHHASFGGDDKNRMVSIASWLLGFSAFMLWHLLTSLRTLEPIQSILVTLLGMIVSTLAVYIVLLYGGYANQNWEKADDIAEKCQWKDLLPDAGFVTAGSGVHAWLNALAKRWATPCKPKEKLAWVFIIYAGGAASLFVIHLVVLILASVTTWR